MKQFLNKNNIFKRNKRLRNNIFYQNQDTYKKLTRADTVKNC
jgi:hypothetical protein